MYLSEILEIKNKYEGVEKKYIFPYINDEGENMNLSFFLDYDVIGRSLSVLEFLINSFNLYDILKEENVKMNILNAIGSVDIEGANVSFSEVEKKHFLNFRKGMRMFKNVNKVYEKDVFDLTEKNICSTWKQIIKNCCENKKIKGKQYRSGDVIVGDFKPIHYKYIERFYPLFLEQIKKEDNDIIRAILLHYGTAFYHPFCDGNGRLSRALMRNELKKAKLGIELIPYDFYLYQNRYIYYESFKYTFNCKSLRFFIFPLVNLINTVLVNILVYKKYIIIDEKYKNKIKELENTSYLSISDYEYAEGVEKEIFSDLINCYYLYYTENNLNRIKIEETDK